MKILVAVLLFVGNVFAQTFYPTNPVRFYPNYNWATYGGSNSVPPPALTSPSQARITSLAVVWQGALVVEIRASGRAGIRYALETSRDMKVWELVGPAFMDIFGKSYNRVPFDPNRAFFRIRGG